MGVTIMSDEKMYGSPTLEKDRWRRVVRRLDEVAPNWRRKHDDYDGPGDDALAAIDRLAKPDTEALVQMVRENLARITIELAQKHGRKVVIAILNSFSASKVSELSLGVLDKYRERALEELAKDANPVPTKETWDKHAEQYPMSHKGMRYRLDRIARGEGPPPQPKWRG
jgi:histone H3/H4